MPPETTARDSRPLAELLSDVAGLLKHVTTHVNRLAEDVARDAGEVVRSAEAFGHAAQRQWSSLRADVARDADALGRAAHREWTSLRDDVARDADALGRAAHREWTSLRDDVARDAAELEDAAQRQWASVREGVRATPRLTRVLAEGARLLALWRWHRLRALARGEEPTDNPAIHRALAVAAREACVELRGGILKLGQLASCRPDLLPAPWIEELSRLQDQVPALPFEAIAAVIEHELGAPLAERFAAVEPEALAAASLAQVHAARALDGADVVIKVQVPGIAEVIESDIAALRVLVRLAGDVVAGIDLSPVVSELGAALARELDYRQEAATLRRFAEAAARVGDPVVTPAPVEALTTGRVLVMERIAGERLTTALERAAAAGDLAARDQVCAALVSSVARQVFAHGLVHGDPHPGNLLVTPDGALALLDFGCVLELTAAERAAWARLFAALIGRDQARAAAELAAIGFVADRPEELLGMAAVIVDAMRPGLDAGEIDWNAQLAELTGRLAAVGRGGGAVTVPPSFVLLSRVLGTLAGILVRHQPRLQPFALIAPHLAAAARG
jgi:predicted unusual protein kinase regulating ubiquinone biosynthesis (AarF/ABC1/UbiB family)